MSKKIINPVIVGAAKNFWTKAGGTNTWPCDIEGAVLLGLPVIIVQLSRLSVDQIQVWLTQKNIYLDLGVANRLLHGMLVTHKDFGIIFMDGSDDMRDRRFTIAHEVAHFLLNYMLPRQRALKKLGPQFKEVLDGLREPTIVERVEGILLKTVTNPRTYLLERDGEGGFRSQFNWQSENNADALAVEILAPYRKVCADMPAASRSLSYLEAKMKAAQILHDKYLLPASIAEEYSGRIAYLTGGGTTLVDRFGLK
ncbi:ImmA/IrrE family metallo-endopeptidase [Fulvivirgaceae bacterium BMA12]|uniref:ImmA/IrrE family metallo-endopeptidase n=1 Tax=Agaribacillus aureus TaxID=3051825 RepID=A0ABT8L1L3_9BACT|nr:ImmA/IrrE family metallo-endopeptidase [Fulvivirgaceae bacterium BMA12]